MKKIFIFLLLILGCTSTSIKSLNNDFDILKGTLAAPPQFSEAGDRLFIYLKIIDKVKEKESVLVAVAENTENKTLLKELSSKLNNSPNEPVYLYGSRTDGKVWAEFITGIDFIIVAAGVYIPQTQNYQVVITNFGERGKDAFLSLSWGKFLKSLTRAAIKAL